MAKNTLLASLPILFKVGNNILENIELYLNEKGFLTDNIILFSGSTFSKKIANEIDFIKEPHRITVLDNGLLNTNNTIKQISNLNPTLLISVGGGKVSDVVKFISLKLDIVNICIPTIISNDGLISPISVLSENNKSISLKGQAPSGIIIDKKLVNNKKYLLAAAGDILSNLSSTNDWLLSKINTGEKIVDLSFQLSRSSAISLINSKSEDFTSIFFIDLIINGQINSGIAMQIAGSSRPCSGSEHLISHAIDSLLIKGKFLHGTQVGSLSLFSLYLQEKLNSDIINYALKLGLPLSLPYLDTSEEQLKLIFKTSRAMRPGRFTVLDKFSDDELVEKYKYYKLFVS